MRSPAATVRWIAAVLLACYSVVVFRLTLLPATSERDTFVLLYRIGTRLGFTTVQTEALANVALFVPVGFLLAVLLARTWAGALGGVLGSVCIELGQNFFLPTRVPSLADVEHNGLGAIIGAVIAWPLAHWIRTGARRRASVAA